MNRIDNIEKPFCKNRMFSFFTAVAVKYDIICKQHGSKGDKRSQRCIEPPAEIEYGKYDLLHGYH